MSFIFILTYLIWLLSEVLLNRLLGSKTTDKQNLDKNSLPIIWITIIIAISVVVFISAKTYFPIFSIALLYYIGLAMIWFGIALRLIAVASLGKFFTVDVTIRQNHKLKRDGLYKYVRHPSYLASLISFIGFGITLNNWIALILITLAVTAVFIIRIKVEEKVLIEQFGAEYNSYKKSTSGLIPFIY